MFWSCWPGEALGCFPRGADTTGCTYKLQSPLRLGGTGSLSYGPTAQVWGTQIIFWMGGSGGRRMWPISSGVSGEDDVKVLFGRGLRRAA